ncbi:ribonuclease H-like domain-containing protein [Tanacetum coccineum]
MLADLLLPIPFWAEAVNTACYVQNRVLVTKPHNKTPYELLIGRTPIVSFMRLFGGNRTNGNAGIETNSDAGQAGKDKVPDQEYILLPLMHTSSEEDVSSLNDDAADKKTEQESAKEEA